MVHVTYNLFLSTAQMEPEPVRFWKKFQTSTNQSTYFRLLSANYFSGLGCPRKLVTV